MSARYFFGEEMKVELLYFDGCPSWKQGLENLKAALELENIKADIELIQVETPEDATKEKFLGSPCFRFEGNYLWPEERSSYHLGCRVYATPDGMHGFPTIEMLREKLKINK